MAMTGRGPLAVDFCHSTFQKNARFLEFGSENANMATLPGIAEVLVALLLPLGDLDTER